MIAIFVGFTRAISTLATAVLFGAVAPANAVPVQIEFDASLSFDRNAVVAAGGIKAADVIAEIFGAGFGSAGTVPLTGSFSYESTTPVFQQQLAGTSSVANYLGAVTAAQLRIAGGPAVAASMPVINSSPSNGLFVTGVGPNNSCLGGDISLCGTAPFVATTNAALVADNTSVVITGSGGAVTFTTRDSFSVALGATTAAQEFAPSFSTGVVGDVFVEGLLFFAVGNLGANLFDSAALPSSAAFFDLNQIDTTVIAILFNGPKLISPFVAQGSASNISISAPIPEPQTYALLLVGLTILGAVARRRTSS